MFVSAIPIVRKVKGEADRRDGSRSERQIILCYTALGVPFTCNIMTLAWYIIKVKGDSLKGNLQTQGLPTWFVSVT
mgnify:CR=1 FL=1